MCEVAIFSFDRTNQDPYLDAKCYKRGDVVEVLEDGAQWGQAVLASPNFRIVRFQGIAAADLAFLCAEEPPEGQTVSRVLQRRSHYLNLGHALLSSHDSWFADDTRAEPVREISLNFGQISAIRQAHPRRAEPNVL